MTWLNNQVGTWYEECIHKLVPMDKKCLNVIGDYVERQSRVCAKTCLVLKICMGEKFISELINVSQVTQW